MEENLFVVKQGWVQKQSRFRNQWRKRWLVLTSSTMVTYKEANRTGKTTENVELSDCEAAECSDSVLSMANSFCVISKGHNFFFLAEDEHEKALWVEFFNICITKESLKLTGRTGPLKEGWIVKRSRYLKDWRRRQLVVTPQRIMTYRIRPGKPTEDFDIRNAVLQDCTANEVDPPHSFKVVVGKKTFYFAADSSFDKEVWMKVIELTRNNS